MGLYCKDLCFTVIKWVCGTRQPVIVLFCVVCRSVILVFEKVEDQAGEI